MRTRIKIFSATQEAGTAAAIPKTPERCQHGSAAGTSAAATSNAPGNPQG